MLPAYDCRGREVPISERFWCKVDIGDEGSCWEWKAARHNYRGGYGTFRIRKGKMIQAHRFALQDTYGVDIPSGMEVDHFCKNPSCVNPAHLEIVTPQENTLRSNSSGAIAVRTGCCRHGHEFTEENTRWEFKRGRWKRACRRCNTLSARERRKDPEVRERHRAADQAYRARKRTERKAGQ